MDVHIFWRSMDDGRSLSVPDRYWIADSEAADFTGSVWPNFGRIVQPLKIIQMLATVHRSNAVILVASQWHDFHFCLPTNRCDFSVAEMKCSNHHQGSIIYFFYWKYILFLHYRDVFMTWCCLLTGRFVHDVQLCIVWDNIVGEISVIFICTDTWMPLFGVVCDSTEYTTFFGKEQSQTRKESSTVVPVQRSDTYQ